MKNLLLTSVIAILCIGCSCKQTETTSTPSDGTGISMEDFSPRDSSLYEMGCRHAAYLINHYAHPDSIAEQLLEVRARETELRRRVDRKGADAYIFGFTSYLKENDPQVWHFVCLNWLKK